MIPRDFFYIARRNFSLRILTGMRFYRVDPARRESAQDHASAEYVDQANERAQNVRSAGVLLRIRSLCTSVLSRERRGDRVAERLRASCGVFENTGDRWPFHVRCQSSMGAQRGLPTSFRDSLQFMDSRRSNRLRRSRKGKLLGRYDGQVDSAGRRIGGFEGRRGIVRRYNVETKKLAWLQVELLSYLLKQNSNVKVDSCTYKRLKMDVQLQKKIVVSMEKCKGDYFVCIS